MVLRLSNTAPTVRLVGIGASRFLKTGAYPPFGISIVSVRVKDRLDKLNAAAKQKDDAEMKAALAGA
jgi:hypothetical protein